MAKVKLNTSKCKGCLLCIRFCPKAVFSEGRKLNDKGFKPVQVGAEYVCIGCGQCVQVCPECAIEITP